MGFWNFFSKKVQPEKVRLPDTDIHAERLEQMVNSLTEIINESLNICETTKNIETKKSRVGVAEDKLNELKKLCRENGNITLSSLTEIELLISKHKTESGLTIDRDFDDLVKGFIFRPTLKLKTPLWLLKKDGELFQGEVEDLPKYGDDSQCFWSTKFDPKYDFLSKGRTSASDAGQVIREQYITYAISYREIIEGELSVIDKINAINELPKSSSTHRTIHNKIVTYYDGIEELHDYAFTNVKEKIDYYSDKDGYLYLINGLHKAQREQLICSGINNIHQLSEMSDKDLLSIKGIGKVLLQRIRASIGGNEP